MRVKFLILVVLVVFMSSYTPAQACWGTFGKFIITNSAGKKVSNASIELLAAPSDEKYKDLWEKFGNKAPGSQVAPFKIPAAVGEEIIKQNLPLARNEDPCGNPLKQTSGKTRVKTWEDKLNDREGKKENFGFCTRENGPARFLLKISASGYTTDYYIGSYLGGCSGVRNFTLTKKNRSLKLRVAVNTPTFVRST
jgi:hypothetical protein